MADPVLGLARALLDAGLPWSAGALLASTGLRGHAINRLRRRAGLLAGARSLPPRIHALGLAGETGIAFPVAAARGLAASEMEHVAHRVCATLLGHDRLPALRAVLPDGLRPEGRSAGLAVLLAFASRLAGRSPARPVFASAGLGADGSLLPVAGLAQKLAAAAGELAGGDGLILLHDRDATAAVASGLPVIGVATAREALDHALGHGLRLDPALLSFHELVREVRAQPDPQRGLELLRAYDGRALPAADRVQYLFEVGTFRRHIGDATGAAVDHAAAERLLDEVARVLGPALVETLQMELLATAVDQYEFDGLAPRVRRRLWQPFCQAHNEVRCRGMLAQVLSSCGQAPEAMRLREQNLVVQQQSEAMAAEVPRTLCHLLRDVGRVGDGASFEQRAAELAASPHADIPGQVAFNEWALLFGLVALGRHAVALDWARGHVDLWGLRASPATRDLLAGHAGITGYPLVSTARVVIRALRRCGESEEAARLTARVQPGSQAPLVSWLALLAVLEGMLAERADRPARRHELAVALRAAYPPAARFHRSLLRTIENGAFDSTAIEAELNAVYY